MKGNFAPKMYSIYTGLIGPKKYMSDKKYLSEIFGEEIQRPLWTIGFFGQFRTILDHLDHFIFNVQGIQMVKLLL